MLSIISADLERTFRMPCAKNHTSHRHVKPSQDEMSRIRYAYLAGLTTRLRKSIRGETISRDTCGWESRLHHGRARPEIEEPDGTLLWAICRQHGNFLSYFCCPMRYICRPAGFDRVGCLDDRAKKQSVCHGAPFREPYPYPRDHRSVRWRHIL
jgi:hypothetical protein